MDIAEDVKGANAKGCDLTARLQAQADGPILDPVKAMRWAQFDDLFGNVVSSGYELPSIASAVRSGETGR
jgi:hypothetical protein